MNKLTKQYIKDCKNVFPFNSKKEKIFLKRFSMSVEDYVIEKENIVYNDLISSFGTPKEIMTSYIQDCDDEYITAKMNTKRIINISSIIISLLLILSLTIISLFELKTIKESKKQHVITEEITISED